MPNVSMSMHPNLELLVPTHYAAKLQQTQQAMTGLGLAAGKMATSFGTLLSFIGKLNTALGAINLVIDAVKIGLDFAEEGAQLMRLSEAGDRLAASFGVNMDEMVRKLKGTSLGTVSEANLIASANRAMMMGIGADADKLANLMEIAAFQGRALGLSANEAFDQIVTGISNADPKLLAHMGLLIDTRQAYEEYSQATGKPISRFDRQDVTQAVFNNVLAVGNTQVAAGGGLELDEAAQSERLSAAWSDYWSPTKELLAKPVAAVKGWMADQMEGWNEYNRTVDRAEELGIARRGQRGLFDTKTGRGITFDQLKEMLKRFDDIDKEYAAADQAMKNFASRMQSTDTGQAFGGFVLSTEEAMAGLQSLHAVMDSTLGEGLGQYQENIAALREEEALLVEQIEELESKDWLNDRQKGELDNLRGQLGGVRVEIGNVEDAWERQTSELVFHMAEQQLAMDGLTTTEMEALRALAGPEGLGLIDEAMVALLAGVEQASTTTAGAYGDAMKRMATAMKDPTASAEYLQWLFKNIDALDPHVVITVDVETAVDAITNLGLSPELVTGIGFGGATLDSQTISSVVTEQKTQNTTPTRNDALGGPLHPLTLVGEQGPELIINGIVVPSHMTRALMGLGLRPGSRFAAGGPLIDGVHTPTSAVLTQLNKRARSGRMASVKASRRAVGESQTAIAGGGANASETQLAIQKTALEASQQAAQQVATMSTTAVTAAVQTQINVAMQQVVSEMQQQQHQQSQQLIAKVDELITVNRRGATDRGVARAVKNAVEEVVTA